MRVTRILLLAGGVVVLAALVASIGLDVIATTLGQVGLGFLWVSMMYLGHVILRASALWKALPSRDLGYRPVLRIRLVGEAVEMLTFTGPFLAEPAKGRLLSGQGIASAHAFGAVVIEYLLYTVVSAWLAGAAFSIFLSRGTLPDGLHGPVVGMLVAVIVFTLGTAFAAVSGIGLIAPTLQAVGSVISARRTAALVSRIKPIERVLVSFLHEEPWRVLELLAFEFAGHGLLVAEIWVILRALGIHIAAVDALCFEGGVKFIAVVFAFVPGQIGAAEGTYTLLARGLGLPVAAGLTLALVRRIRALIVAGLGLAVSVVWK
jgi:hypothetical protein